MTIFGAAWAAVLLPYNMAWMVVFEPMHLIMWIIVEKIGGKEIWGADRLMKNKNMATLVKWTKEFRGVLCDYYGWPKIASGGGSPKCKFCSNKAKWWCVDCNKKMCPQCTYNQHTAGTSTASHSIEEIVTGKEKKGVHFLTPVLPELMFVFVVSYAFLRVNLLRDDYLSTQVVCPLVNAMRGATATLDANIFYYYKSSFATWCDVEDSFMRFILDFWVRTIVTGTDDTVLVFQNFPKAMLFDVILMAAAVPVFSVMYAILLAVIYQLECQIPSDFVYLEEYAQKLAVSGQILSFLGIGGADGNFPPETKPRKRDDGDTIEGLKYKRARLFRRWDYYYHSSLDTLRQMAWQLLMGILVARLVCIWIDVLPLFLRGICRVFCLGGFIDADQVRFAGATSNVLSEPVIRKAVKIALSIGKSIVLSMPSVVAHASLVWAILIIIAVIINYFIISAIIMDRRRFQQKWSKEGGMEKALTFGQEKTLQ